MKSLIKPPKLKPNANIRIVSPASSPDMQDLSKGVALLKHLGYNISFGSSIRRLMQRAYLSAPDEERAAELMAAFKDDSVDAIFSARGGYGSIRILPYLDYDVIRSHPKIFVGYSDITSIHLAINKQANMITFHGPMVGTDLDEMKKPTFKLFIDVLEGNTTDISSYISRIVKYVVPGTATGVSMGTNFSVVASLAGTKYFPDPEGKILLLEDVGATAWDIDRYFSTLKLTDAFDKFNGFVFGDFTDIPKIEEPMPFIEEIIQYYLSFSNKPSLYGMPFGHGADQMLLPLNAKIKMNTESPYIELIENVVD